MQSARERDRYQWTTETAQALRAGKLEGVNMADIAEELAQVGRSDARELRNRVGVLMEHLLKLDFVKGPKWAECHAGWKQTVRDQREELDSLLEESPSLKTRLTAEFLAKCYDRAANRIQADYQIILPRECRFTSEELLA